MGANKKCEVQLWHASALDVDAVAWRALARLLDASERERASRLRRDVDRQAYVLAHGLRRLALASVLQVPAADLVFRSTASGQPVLMWPLTPAVFFSHSHTCGRALFALSLQGPVGVDIEQTSAIPPDGVLLQPFMTWAQPTPQGSFYLYWTALEAFCKAAGTGLSERLPPIECHAHARGLWLYRPASVPALATAPGVGSVQFPAQSLAQSSAQLSALSSALVLPVAVPSGYVASIALAVDPSAAPVLKSFNLPPDFSGLSRRFVRPQFQPRYFSTSDQDF